MSPKLAKPEISNSKLNARVFDTLFRKRKLPFFHSLGGAHIPIRYEI